MELLKIELCGNDNWAKLRLNDNWNVIKANPNFLYKEIMDTILDKTNIYYYATQRKTSKTLSDARKDVKRAIKNGTIHISMKMIIEKLGFTKEEINISNTRLHGDIGELVMANFIDKFCDPSTIICKVSLKTSPRMSAYGNDNLFYDFQNKILYYGEAKFYERVKDALDNAVFSLNKHSNGELSYIYNSTNNLKSSTKKELKIVEKKFEKISLNDVSIANIIFIMNEDLYLKSNYEELLKEYKSKLNNCILVVFPILSKKDFLNYFKENIELYE